MHAKTVFLHVMKTGGTTFRSILASIHGSNFHVCTDSSIANVEQALNRFEAVELHLSNVPGKGWIHHHAELAAQQRWELLEGRNVFIMFRNPVDQILSHFFSMQRLRAQIEPRMKAIGVDFPEDIDQFLDHRAHFNNQTAFVLARQQEQTFIASHDVGEAINILDRLQVHIGLTERFEDSMSIFQSVTGHTVPPYTIRNQSLSSQARTEISPAIRQRIADRNIHDLALYDYATRRFNQALAASGVSVLTA